MRLCFLWLSVICCMWWFFLVVFDLIRFLFFSLCSECVMMGWLMFMVWFSLLMFRVFSWFSVVSSGKWVDGCLKLCVVSMVCV